MKIDAIDIATIDQLARGRFGALDTACPLCGPTKRKLASRRKKVLRIWRLEPDFATFHCARCGEHGFVRDGSSLTTRLNEAAIARARAEASERERATAAEEQCLIGDSIVASRIVWDAAPVTITANEALAADVAGSEVHSAIEEAVDWLHQLLAEGPIPAGLVRAEADAAGLSWATIKRAKKAGRIEHFREGGVADKGRWLWRLSTSETLTGSSNCLSGSTFKREPVREN